ncbi:hypothetical protein SAMN05428963_108188 [Consotaella salsifontis]|uniref:Phage integrase family protein n=1 Tax=Consotaella salsifontis TaxID=1365950 RepID=A0A1T4S1Z2_9HYPH|nr:hypothetical protein SAMN05428963_108188 [Consotaella salsifontis]
MPIMDLIRWFTGQDRRWAPSTVRQYRAALTCMIEAAAAARRISAEGQETLIAHLKSGPAPRDRHEEPRRTSAKKRKSVPIKEWGRLIGALINGDERDKLAASFISCNLPLGLRPVEYQDACSDGRTLKVINAKATNGRSFGMTRDIDLAPVTDQNPSFPAFLLRFLQRLREAAAEAGGWARLWSRIAARIARACKRCAIRRVSLYSTRHAALATAKQLLSMEEVAALAGHKTTRTATVHYAKRRSGLSARLRCGAPTPETTSQVKPSRKAERQTNIEYHEAAARTPSSIRAFPA